VHPWGEKELFSKEDIKKRIKEIADQINKGLSSSLCSHFFPVSRYLTTILILEYAGRSLVVVGILKGAFIFCADLVRHLNVDVAVEFMSVSSYGDSTQSTVSYLMLIT